MGRTRKSLAQLPGLELSIQLQPSVWVLRLVALPSAATRAASALPVPQPIKTLVPLQARHAKYVH